GGNDELDPLIARSVRQKDSGRVFGGRIPTALFGRRGALVAQAIQCGRTAAPSTVGGQRQRDALGRALRRRRHARQRAHIGPRLRHERMRCGRRAAGGGGGGLGVGLGGGGLL